MATIGQLQVKHVKKLEAKVEAMRQMIELLIPLHEASGCDKLVEKAKAVIANNVGIN